MDRNIKPDVSYNIKETSLSARRAWIEMSGRSGKLILIINVALRKESVDRNFIGCIDRAVDIIVALRKESVDRNKQLVDKRCELGRVALRKESVDRNPNYIRRLAMSVVALRKESVDRNRSGRIRL